MGKAKINYRLYASLLVMGLLLALSSWPRLAMYAGFIPRKP